MADSITSTKNPIVRRFRSVAAGDDPRAFLAEGIKLVGEALAAGLAPVEAAFVDRVRERDDGDHIVRELGAAGPSGGVHACSPSVMGRLSSVKAPPGVVAVFERPSRSIGDLVAPAPALVVVAAGLRDPGNLGALVRAAEAAGATGLVAAAGGADPWREKAVRGSAGSAFRLPVIGSATASGVERLCAEHGLQRIVADGGGADSYLDVDYARPTCLVLGAEAEGVPDEFLTGEVRRVRIPMARPVESLNVAVAAGVLMFEARRQRGGGS